MQMTTNWLLIEEIIILVRFRQRDIFLTPNHFLLPHSFQSKLKFPSPFFPLLLKSWNFTPPFLPLLLKVGVSLIPSYPFLIHQNTALLLQATHLSFNWRVLQSLSHISLFNPHPIALSPHPNLNLFLPHWPW